MSKARHPAPKPAGTTIRRIVLLGGESSGKTTLAAALAAHYRTPWVPEYGRELWEQQGGSMSEADLLKVAGEQIRREEAALPSTRRFLFCDTSPLTTAGYSVWMFGHIDPRLERLAQRPYDAALLCQPDFPFVADGARREAAFRDEQHVWYQEQTRRLHYPVFDAAGSVDERVAQIVAWLPTLKYKPDDAT